MAIPVEGCFLKSYFLLVNDDSISDNGAVINGWANIMNIYLDKKECNDLNDLFKVEKTIKDQEKAKEFGGSKKKVLSEDGWENFLNNAEELVSKVLAHNVTKMLKKNYDKLHEF